MSETIHVQPQGPEPPPFTYSPHHVITLACASGLIGCFFAPWLNFDRLLSPWFLQQHETPARYLWVIPLSALFTISVHRDARLLARIGTLTALLTGVTMFWFFQRLGPHGLLSIQWGASLSILCMLGLFAFCAERKFTVPFDFIAKKLGSRKAEVYSHWGTFTPDIHFSTQDFYLKLESAIKTKAWPGVQVLRVEYREAGLLSHQREYLRILRQRQVFDVCAATFGTDYFFSLREAEIPSVVTVRAFLSVMLGLFVLLGAFIQLLGLLLGIFTAVFLLIFAIWFLFNILKMGLTKVDSMLLTLPVIGPVYENWFRSDTYFQQDTRILFLHSVSELVKAHVEETTSAKGLRFLNCFEKKPILGGLYTPATLRLKLVA